MKRKSLQNLINTIKKNDLGEKFSDQKKKENLNHKRCGDENKYY